MPTAAVKTARAITRGFVSAMKSGTRTVSPNHEGNCTRETGMLSSSCFNPLRGTRCVLFASSPQREFRDTDTRQRLLSL